MARLSLACVFFCILKHKIFLWNFMTLLFLIFLTLFSIYYFKISISRNLTQFSDFDPSFWSELNLDTRLRSKVFSLESLRFKRFWFGWFIPKKQTRSFRVKKEGSEKFLSQRKFLVKKILVQKMFVQIKILGTKIIFGSKKVWVQKIFGLKKFFGPKKFLG